MHFFETMLQKYHYHNTLKEETQSHITDFKMANLEQMYKNVYFELKVIV